MNEMRIVTRSISLMHSNDSFFISSICFMKSLQIMNESDYILKDDIVFGNILVYSFLK